MWADAQAGVRVGDLAECQNCDHRRLRSKILCAECGKTRRPSLGDAARCEHCVGEPIRHVCRDCGAEEHNHTGGRCARRSLAEVLRRLRADGQPAAIATLEPYLVALGSGPQPSTTLKWMGRSPGYETLIELATGAREISHRALDDVKRGMTTMFLRAALVTHGVLEPRGEQTAKFERTARSAVNKLPVVRTAPRSARTRYGRSSMISHAASVAAVPASAPRRAVCGWCALRLSSPRGPACAACRWARLRQEHIDRWLHEGSSATESIAPFLRWAARGGLMAPLTARSKPARTHVEPISHDERLGVVRRLLHDDAVDLRDRVAGLLILV